MNDDPRPPRDWLLARHAVQQSQLDALRRATLADQSTLSFAEALRALFLPHRRAWQALSLVWLLLLTAHLALRHTSPRASTLAPSPEAIAHWFPQFSSRETLAQTDLPR